MRAWPAPAQGLLATGFSGTITPPLNLSPLSAFGTAIQLNSQQSITYDAANSTGIMNGVNAQTFSVYNTFTAGTPDYERMEMRWTGNSAILDVTKSGTGTQRTMNISCGGNVGFSISSTFLTTVGISAATSLTGNNVSIGTGFFSPTAGTLTMLALSPSFRDQGTTSTTVAQCIAYTPTINYTAASKTGKVVLANFAPTLTSQPSGRNAGISFSSAFTSSTFPALKFNNVADEDTNFEYGSIGWHLNANAFAFRTDSGGTGTARVMDFYYSGAVIAAIRVPTGVTGTVDMALSATNGAAVTAARVRVGSGSSTSATSGTHTTLNLADSYAPTATSTMVAYGLSVTPTINYSNGTPGAGSVYGIYVKPTNTALPTGLNAGIALASTASGLTGAVMYHNQTDETTNFEYVTMGFNSNIFKISSVKGGTGTLRGIQVGISGNSIGFYGVTPAARPAAYTLTATVVASRTLNANASATVANNNSVIAQMIQDLQAVGLFQ